MMRKKDGYERRRAEQYAAEAIEEENDACIVDLEAKVQSLKHVGADSSLGIPLFFFVGALKPVPNASEGMSAFWPEVNSCDV